MSIKKEGYVSPRDSSMKIIDEESMVWPFQRMGRLLLHLENFTGTFLLILFLNCLLIVINFLLYGNVEIFSLGHNYFIRSLDPFLKFEATRLFFKENIGIENIALPFLAHLVNKGFILLGLNYTKDVFYVITILPYFVFMVMFSCVARKSIGIVGAISLSFALHSSGITPIMLSWGGSVDGVSYLILFLAFLSINKSYPLTLLLIVVGSLNHYLSVLGILVISLSMFIMKPKIKFIWIVVSCLVVLCVVNFIWTNQIGGEGARSNHIVEKLRSRSFSMQAREVYGVFPWNFLSPLKLMTIPLLYLALLLFKKKVFLGLGYILPIVFGILLLLAFDDVTRILTFFFIISFFMMIAIMTGCLNFNKVMVLKMDFVSKRKLYNAIVFCSFLSIFVPDFYVDNGLLHVPHATFNPLSKPSVKKTVIAYGSPRVDSIQSKFGGASVRFHGEGDRLVLTEHEDWEFDLRDFTVDFWIRFANTSGTQMIVGHDYYSPDRSWQIAWEESRKSLLFSYSTSEIDGIDVRFPWSPTADTWYHVAIVRNGSYLKAFVKGSQIGSKHHIGGAIHDSKKPLLIGSRGMEEHFNGWLDEIRISKGIARWASNFAPRRREYSKDSYTKLLLHCNDTEGF